MATQDKRIGVGIIGAGEVAQVVHLPTLTLMSHLFQVHAIADISAKTATHCAQKFHIPLSTTNPLEVISHPSTSLIFILTSDDSHELYTTLSLQSHKNVFLEKPSTLSLPSIHRIITAESTSQGNVFVGYMRRYAKSYTDYFRREVASIPKITYARVRDFPGPNPRFVSESGAFAVLHSDDVPASKGAERDERLKVLLGEALGEQTSEAVTYARFLGTLGSHDISLMRDCLGSPERVVGVSVNDPVYTAMFDYRNKDGSKFSVTYESGWDEVPDFDAHLAVYGERKRVTIKYDTPFVKGLPIKVIVQEANERGEIQSRKVLQYEDAYTSEMQEVYRCFAEGKEIKTSAKDAMEDLKIYDKMYAQWRKQEA